MSRQKKWKKMKPCQYVEEMNLQRKSDFIFDSHYALFVQVLASDHNTFVVCLLQMHFFLYIKEDI